MYSYRQKKNVLYHSFKNEVESTLATDAKKWPERDTGDFVTTRINLHSAVQNNTVAFLIYRDAIIITGANYGLEN